MNSNKIILIYDVTNADPNPYVYNLILQDAFVLLRVNDNKSDIDIIRRPNEINIKYIGFVFDVTEKCDI